MRRRRVIAGLVVAVAVAAVILWPRPPRPCRATFEQVREGMTREAVIATVGGPPGDYTDGYHLNGWVNLGGAGRQPTSWIAADGVLAVRFDADGLAATVLVHDFIALSQPPTFWTLLRTRLGL